MSQTLMRQEILEIPDAVERLLTLGQNAQQSAAAQARAFDPAFLISVARGSSDHAATYLKYTSELVLGLVLASVGPSVASVYNAPLKLDRALGITISQSGQSPDIVALTKAARNDGALTVSITNEPDSPLARASALSLPLHAGKELSVAATKTFVTSVVAGLIFMAEWARDDDLKAALYALPAHLEKAVKNDWPELRTALKTRESLFTIGRGPSWAIAGEAALKLKETCLIHGEAYSSAEVLHGPVSIVEQGFPVLGFAVGDQAEQGLIDVADKMADMGANVFVTSNMAQRANSLAHVRTGHPLTDPITLIISFYAMVEKLALSRGIAPDSPRHLRKVTETV